MELTPDKIVRLLKASEPVAARLITIGPVRYEDSPAILKEEERMDYMNFPGAVMEMHKMSELARSDYNRTDTEIFNYFQKLSQKAGLDEPKFRVLATLMQAPLPAYQLELLELMLSRPWK